MEGVRKVTQYSTGTARHRVSRTSVSTNVIKHVEDDFPPNTVPKWKTNGSLERASFSIIFSSLVEQVLHFGTENVQ